MESWVLKIPEEIGAFSPMTCPFKLKWHTRIHPSQTSVGEYLQGSRSFLCFLSHPLLIPFFRFFYAPDISIVGICRSLDGIFRLFVLEFTCSSTIVKRDLAKSFALVFVERRTPENEVLIALVIARAASVFPTADALCSKEVAQPVRRKGGQ